jgi:hypothetical protein
VNGATSENKGESKLVRSSRGSKVRDGRNEAPKRTDEAVVEPFARISQPMRLSFCCSKWVGTMVCD